MKSVFGQINMISSNKIKALTFDVFGTIGDWRSSIVDEGKVFNQKWQEKVDWEAFALAWRGLYEPFMEVVRQGKRPWVILDVLHREILLSLLPQFGLNDLSESEIDHLNYVWHRLKPWPDCVEGLSLLKKKFIIAALSNGNIALIMNMAKNAGLSWDVILGAEVARAYKPQSEIYITSAQMLCLDPSECLMVAAHNHDLQGAKSAGFRTAFVRRSTEYGSQQNTDLAAENGYDLVAEDLFDLAQQLGC